LLEEKRRRLQESVDAGTSIAVVVTGIPHDDDAPIEQDDESLDGPITVVVTGVPRASDPPSKYHLPDVATKPSSYPSSEPLGLIEEKPAERTGYPYPEAGNLLNLCPRDDS
jgi:hypothetical protein